MPPSQRYEGATILCLKSDVSEVLSVVEERAESLVVSDEDGQWTEIAAKFSDGWLNVTMKVPTTPQEGEQISDFGRIILGINNLIRKRIDVPEDKPGSTVWVGWGQLGLSFWCRWGGCVCCREF